MQRMARYLLKVMQFMCDTMLTANGIAALSMKLNRLLIALF